MLILRTPFYFILLHTHENTFTIFCPVTSSLVGKKKKGKGNIKAISFFNKTKVKEKEMDNHITLLPRHNNVLSISH